MKHLLKLQDLSQKELFDILDLASELKAELIPEGYTVYAAAFFGYPGPDVKDRGERKGTVSYL